jgi:uncharacterized membrane protein YadS
MWCAAIHDTSSVVAASKYGSQALEIATTVKLARALWIIPIAFIHFFIQKKKTKSRFRTLLVCLYSLCSRIRTPFVQDISSYLTTIAKSGLTLTLSYRLHKEVLASVGYKPLLQGIVLWLLISSMALWVVISLF